VTFTAHSRIYLLDYSPNTPPHIPFVISHCADEIQRRGFGESNLYCSSNVDQHEVDQLSRKMINFIKKPNQPAPDLSNVNMHLLCEIIKQFLSRLDDPIIPRVIRSSLINAASKKDGDEITKQLRCMQVANRHTLSFLIVQFVSLFDHPGCQTNKAEFIDIMAPILVGYSISNISAKDKKLEDPMIKRLVEELLSIPFEFWSVMLDSMLGVGNAKNISLGGKLTANGMMTPRHTNQKSKPSWK
jgi:hypothetical protein